MIITPQDFYKQEIGYLQNSVTENPSLQVVGELEQYYIDDFNKLGWKIESFMPRDGAEITEICNQPVYDNIIIKRSQLEKFSIDPKIIPRNWDCDGIGENPIVWPFTVRGVLNFLKSNKVQLVGLKAVVIGRSERIGKPFAQALLEKDATVIQCHSRTPYKVLKEFIRTADIIVCAVGSAKFLERNDVNPGAIVIDVGINKKPNGVLVGDFSEFNKNVGSGWSVSINTGLEYLMRIGLLRNCVTLKRYQLELERKQKNGKIS